MIETDGKRYAYFDNAATTFVKPNCVYEAMDKCTRELCVNAGRGQYTLAAKSGVLIEETRRLMCTLFFATSDDICVFTDSVTTALNVIINGAVNEATKNVYITPFEHNAVLRPLYNLQKKYNFTLQELFFDAENCHYDLAEIKNQFEKNLPDILIMTHASNAFGFVTPIEKIATLARSANKSATVIIDAAQTAGLLDINFRSGLFDYVAFAGHKSLYAIFGVAGFVCKKSSTLEPLIFGGTGIESANHEMPNELPMRLEAGSHNIIAIASLNAALKEISSVGRENLFTDENEKHKKLVEILQEFDNIKIIGQKTHAMQITNTSQANNSVANSEISETVQTIGIVSATFRGYAPDEIGSVLDAQNVYVRTGLHCAPLAAKKMNVFPAGTVRFSVGRFTNENDFSALRSALQYIKNNG